MDLAECKCIRLKPPPGISCWNPARVKNIPIIVEGTPRSLRGVSAQRPFTDFTTPLLPLSNHTPRTRLLGPQASLRPFGDLSGFPRCLGGPPLEGLSAVARLLSFGVVFTYSFLFFAPVCVFPGLVLIFCRIFLDIGLWLVWYPLRWIPSRLLEVPWYFPS